MNFSELKLLVEETLIIKPFPDRKGLFYSNHFDFLYLLTKKYKFNLMVELGTYIGYSALHMRKGNPDGKLYTIDINEKAGGMIKEEDNINLIIGDSVESASKVPNDIDLLFIDAKHDDDSPMREFATYLPKMKEGGLILMDDIYDHPQGIGKLWKELTMPKLDLVYIHKGYGIGAVIIEGDKNEL